VAGDKFGRKWPMVLNMIILGLLQVATIYAGTFQQFLGVRSLSVSSWEVYTATPSPWRSRTALSMLEVL